MDSIYLWLTLILASLTSALRNISAAKRSLQQPSCNDADPDASAIFSLGHRARTCEAAFSNQTDATALVRYFYKDFVEIVEEFERQYDRYCRWQRITQPPPKTQEKHEYLFGTVASAHLRLLRSEREIMERMPEMGGLCGGMGLEDIDGFEWTKEL